MKNILYFWIIILNLLKRKIDFSKFQRLRLWFSLNCQTPYFDPKFMSRINNFCSFQVAIFVATFELVAKHKFCYAIALSLRIQFWFAVQFLMLDETVLYKNKSTWTYFVLCSRFAIENGILEKLSWVSGVFNNLRAWNTPREQFISHFDSSLTYFTAECVYYTTAGLLIYFLFSFCESKRHCVALPFAKWNNTHFLCKRKFV